jgi:hypothetical protein
VVAAPAGFGKTTLLLHWRRSWMVAGALVAWLDADDQDEPERFAQALLYSLRTASGRPVDPAAQCTTVPGLEGLTRLLSEWRCAARRPVLMIDDGERLPAASVQTVLQYLLMNAPANLHVVIGTRVPLPLLTCRTRAKGFYAALTGDGPAHAARGIDGAARAAARRAIGCGRPRSPARSDGRLADRAAIGDRRDRAGARAIGSRCANCRRATARCRTTSWRRCCRGCRTAWRIS